MKTNIFLLITALSLFAIGSIIYPEPSFVDPNIPVSSTNLSGTIATTNTFQEISPQNNSRVGCQLQNKTAGTNTMWIYFDPLNDACATATKALSQTLAASITANCSAAPGYVIKNEICITGTSTDTYFANFQ